MQSLIVLASLVFELAGGGRGIQNEPFTLQKHLSPWSFTLQKHFSLLKVKNLIEYLGWRRLR